MRYVRWSRFTLALCILQSMSAAAAQLSAVRETVTAGSDINLTAEGFADWVHWGLYTDTSVDRKAGVIPQIGNFTLLGDPTTFLAVYQYSDNLHGYSWSDGTPRGSVTNTPTGVWAYGFNPIGSGFELSAPADTSVRTLKVYVGKYNAQARLTAALSDGSALGYSNATTGIALGKENFVYTIQYAAASAGQTLTVRWALLNGSGQTPNVTLQAATLALPPGSNPPAVMITSPTNEFAFAAPAVISLTASATDPDGEVVLVDFYEGTNLIGSDVSSPYTASWTNSAPGRFSLTASAVDTNGLRGTSLPVEVFGYGTGGSQTGQVTAAPGLVDLTGEGTADWVHWGAVGSNSVDRKAIASPLLSEASFLGPSGPAAYSNNLTTFSWTDGSPIATNFGTTTGIFLTGATNGFALSAPADASPRTLRLYVGGYGLQALVQAWLTDFSAPPYIDQSVSNVYGSSYALYTIDYAAASPGQRLQVIYRPYQLFDAVYGNVTLASTTLQQGPPVPQPAHLLDPAYSSGVFHFSFLSQSGLSHVVEYTDSLHPADWLLLTNLVGTGQVLSVTNSSPAESSRYYRVRTE